MSESEAFPKEELSSTQYEADVAQPRERPASELVQQSGQRLKLAGNRIKLCNDTRGQGVILQGEKLLELNLGHVFI